MAIKKCHQFLLKISMMMVCYQKQSREDEPTHNKLEAGEQPHVGADTESLRSERGPELRGSLSDIVDRAQEPDIIRVQLQSAFGIADGTELCDETCR